MKRNFGIETSPAKQHTKYSKKIGPAQNPEKIKTARRSAADVPMGKEHDAEHDVKRAKYDEMKDFQKNIPKENL